MTMSDYDFNGPLREQEDIEDISDSLDALREKNAIPYSVLRKELGLESEFQRGVESGIGSVVEILEQMRHPEPRISKADDYECGWNEALDCAIAKLDEAKQTKEG